MLSVSMVRPPPPPPAADSGRERHAREDRRRHEVLKIAKITVLFDMSSPCCVGRTRQLREAIGPRTEVRLAVVGLAVLALGAVLWLYLLLRTRVCLRRLRGASPR